MFIYHSNLTWGWPNDRSTVKMTRKKIASSKLLNLINTHCSILTLLVPVSYISFNHIPHPFTYRSTYLECFDLHITPRQSRSQDLQICCTLNILYFEHHPPNTIHLPPRVFFISPVFLNTLPPQIRVVNAFRQAQQQQGSANSNLQVQDSHLQLTSCNKCFDY